MRPVSIGKLVGVRAGLLLGLACIAPGWLGATLAAERPNIIFILCDDLGFGDTGPTSQNARAKTGAPAFATPQLDRMAAEGTELRNHYCPAPVCAPSRASLLLGVHQGHANVRDNEFDKALADRLTLGSMLRAGGYATAAIGKWGLQGRVATTVEEDVARGRPELWPAYPTKRGFDYFYGYVRHRDGHFHYPKEDGRQVWENEQEVSAGLTLSYTTDLFTARAKQWIIDQRSARPRQPFFLYLAYDTPHAKLQYPPSPYPAGGGLKGGVQWTGRPGAMINSAQGTVDGWIDPEVAQSAWPEIQRRYAAGVRRIDEGVGDLLQLLRDLGIAENTLVVFSSDNGPPNESNIPGLPFAPDFFAGFGPFDGIKRDVLEGGVREPTFVWWPGRVPPGRVERSPGAFWDWMPTFAELAGLPAPAASDGVSLVPVLTGRGVVRPSTIYVEYAVSDPTPAYAQFAPEHRGQARGQMQMVQFDGLTGVRYNVKSAADDFAIYDVERDPQQADNLARGGALADLQRRMQERVLQIRRPIASSPRPYDAAPVPAVADPGIKAGGLDAGVYRGPWPWIPDFSLLAPEATRTVTAIDGSAGEGGGLAFTGFVRAPTDGEYTFFLNSGGRAMLFIHDARVIDETTGAATETVRLAAGWHPIRLYATHPHGAADLKLEWAGPGISREPLPATALGSKLAARP